MVKSFVLHGGAGNWGKREEKGQKEIENIADKVRQESGSKSAVETVEYAVNLLEENREFNAGKGAKFESDGEIRLDASIMKSNLEAGSVIGLQNFLNPISIARKVMEETHHVSIKGRQAEEFAEKFGFEKANIETEYRKESYREVENRIEGLDLKEKIRELEKEI
jgi:beta-aspartyl-peptidase (threonine type)